MNHSTLMAIAKGLVAFVAIFNFGGYIADALWPFGAKQHMKNPRWPPHAKFHTGQSIFMGILLGSLSLIILYSSQSLTFPVFLFAAAVAGIYFAAMLLAPLFPGTDWTDPEFLAETPRPLGLPPQKLVGYVLMIFLVVAIVIAFCILH